MTKDFRNVGNEVPSLQDFSKVALPEKQQASRAFDLLATNNAPLCPEHLMEFGQCLG